MSTQSFAELGVSRTVISSLSRAGITEPFAIQRAVIADAIAGRDVIGKSPTGSGKTLAFGIPLVERIGANDARPAGLVLAPTRELATQIVDEIRGIAYAPALRVTAVYGGVGLVKQAKDAAASHVLVATPGRLEDLLARGAFRLDRIRMLVLDEADRMLDMGFRPAIDRIVGACPRPARRCSSPPPSTAKLDASPNATRATRLPISMARAGGATARRSSIVSCRSHTSTASRRSSASWGATVSSRSCSCEPSAEPTGSSSGWQRMASTPWRCTATSRSASASMRSVGLSQARSTRSSRPMSRRAGSTSSGSRT